MKESINNNKLMIAVIMLHIGQHQMLKQEQHVFLQAITNHVIKIIIIGKNKAKPYNHGEMH